MRLRLPLAALLLLVCSLSGAAPAAAAKRQVPHGFYGIMYGGAIESAPAEAQDQQWDKLARAGVESARVVFDWNVAQHQQGQPTNWRPTDRAVQLAAARNIAVVPMVMRAPVWARLHVDQYSSPPKETSAYAAFLAALVDRYGPKGTFWSEHRELPRRPLRHWQIWSEPELSDHWYRTGDWLPTEAKRYGALLRASRRAIKKADPGAKVVLGGLTNYAWETLESLHRQGGIRGHFDIAAVHTFPGNYRNIEVILRRVRAVLDRHGERRAPIWITEMTWPAAEGKTPVPDWANNSYYRQFITTETGAASRLRRAYKMLAARRLRTRMRLERVHWFTGLSSYSGSYLWDYTGLLRFNGSTSTAAPSYDAFRDSARRDQGCAKSATGGCR